MTILSLIRKSLILKMIMKFSLKIREFEQNWKMIVIPFIENVEFCQTFEMTKISLRKGVDIDPIYVG